MEGADILSILEAPGRLGRPFIKQLIESSEHNRPAGQLVKAFDKYRWTPEEKKKFIEGVRIFGKDCEKVTKYIGTRPLISVRGRMQYMYLKL